MNYDQLRNIVRLKAMDGDDVEKFAHFATREIVDASKARMLYEELVVTLGNVTVGHWLGPNVAEALRQRAVGIIDEIETSASPAQPKRSARQ